MIMLIFLLFLVMDSSLPTSLKHIISNVEYYGPVLFMAGMMSQVMFNNFVHVDVKKMMYKCRCHK